ncbi:MAG: glycosyltransferase family 1 protein [Ilumatobacteraceae bacterium]
MSPASLDGVRVGVNLLWCVPGAVGGSEQYLVRQLAGAREADPALDLGLYALPEWHRRHADRLPGVRITDAPIDGHQRWRRVITESTWLRRASAGDALMHHGGGTAPLRTVRPFVLTIHDLQFRTFPQHFSTIKRRYLEATVPGSARRATIVTVPTEYVRGTVVDQFGIDPSRVVVVPHGYEPELVIERSPEADLRHRYALGDGPVVVYPAMTAPHKNHAFLIDLMRTTWTDPDLRLVLIGGGGVAADEVAARVAVAEAERPGRIVVAGRVSDADKNGLIAMATALVFPSTYEGFGAPLIEAMALGTPVLCSDATCLPDVAGDAAVVAPLDRDAWRAGLDEVVRRRAELVAAGAERVTHFTSRRSGEALLEAYSVAVSR